MLTLPDVLSSKSVCSGCGKIVVTIPRPEGDSAICEPFPIVRKSDDGFLTLPEGRFVDLAGAGYRRESIPFETVVFLSHAGRCSQTFPLSAKKNRKVAV
jgi:hypothetical protein